MRKDFGSKSWVYPMPVMILAAYGPGDQVMAMNVGWCGAASYDNVIIGLGRHHRTTEYVLASGSFTLSPATADQLAACDYVGIDSGKDVPDKMERSGFHWHRSDHVHAPIPEELPMALECEVVSYDPEAELLTGRVINVSAEESILDDSGRIDADKARFLTLDPGNLRYRIIGPVAGRAFHDGIVLSDKGKARPFDDTKK